MALKKDESELISSLARRHDTEIPELEVLDRWYEGAQGVSYMHPEIFAEAGDRIRQVIVYWTQVAVDSIVERLQWQGWKTGDKDLDKELHRVWIANGMDLGLSQALTDALVMRRAYISVGTNEDDPSTPLVMPESPLELFVTYDARTRKPTAGLRRWCVYDNSGALSEEYGTLYTPNATVWLEKGKGGWVETSRDDHELGEVPIGSLINRPRTSAVANGRVLGDRGFSRPAKVERIGRSDLEPVIPLADAANKLATDMMVAAEFVAIPLRALFGAGPDDFKDQDGKPMSPLKALQGRLLTIPDEDVKAYEFAAAQLQNFTGALGQMSQLTGSVTGLPAHYLGTPSDNPASAEAITASEARMVTRAELKQPAFWAHGLRHVGRLIVRFAEGDWREEMDSARPDWADVRTPSIGARADAAMKLGPKDKPIVPMRQTREALGFDEEQIEEMELADAAVAAQSPGTQLANALTNNLGGAGSGGTAGGPAGG